jgi:hypothetical protein
MTIPLDRLYHYIDDIAQDIYGDRVIIYRFFPHGSKNVNDLSNLYSSDTWADKNVFPFLWCHDQEPLNFEHYQQNLRVTSNEWTEILRLHNLLSKPKNLNYRKNMFEKNLLLHSEKRSLHVGKYINDRELIPVYYWSHAVIALDWFRYANHITQSKHVDKTFLIYNRAWSGTREYRLKFAEYLVRLDLQDLCKTSINPIEPELGIHYETHKFINPSWRPAQVLENFFPTSTAQSYYSADFDIEDYATTDIEIILETLFDDHRLHLTEKSLRPIACGQPFILAGTHGSLEYLRSYGFKTFNSIWDESYDLIEDPQERLCAIVDLMKQIANWLPHQRERKLDEARAVAEYNKKHFFSREFFDLVVNELKTNLTFAFNELEFCNNYTNWINTWTKLLSTKEATDFLNTSFDDKIPTQQGVEYSLKIAQEKLFKATKS